MALDTVADYVTEARRILQDQVEDFRYPDADLVSALNIGIMTARRLRPDLFLNTTPPTFSTNDNTAFTMDVQYRPTFVYFMVGHVQLRDEEDTQDSRAAAFIGKFTSGLMGLA